MKNIFFDSIILALQGNGGISNYWRALVAGIRESREFDSIVSNQDVMLNNGSLKRSIERYCRVSVPDDCTIFHSSYYRTANSKNVKNVTTVYDFMYERFENGIKKLIHRNQKYQTIKQSDLIITISNSTKNDLLNFYPEFSNKRIIVIPLGVDSRIFFNSNQSQTHSDSENTVLFVGGRLGYKRFDVAVEVVSCLENYKLGIVGDPLSEREVSLLDKKLAKRWIFYGKVSNAQLSSIYKSVFCFLFTSSYEGFGLPLIEAQACGCPVVASNTSSLAEVGGCTVMYGDNGDISTYINSINSLENKSVRNKIIELGLANSKKYSWGNCVNATLSAYKTIC